MTLCWKPADLVKNRTLRVLLSAARVHPMGIAPVANAAAAAAAETIACRRVTPFELVDMQSAPSG